MKMRFLNRVTIFVHVVFLYLVSGQEDEIQEAIKRIEYKGSYKNPMNYSRIRFDELSENSGFKQKHGCLIQIQTFDRDIIINTDYDFHIRLNESENEYMRVNLCGDLVSKCAGVSQGYGVCYIKDGKEIRVGKSNPDIVLHDDNAVFLFTGDKCNANHNFTILFQLVCDPYVEDTIIVSEEQYIARNCEFNMILSTNIACKVKERYGCNLKYVDNRHYNLNRLENIRNDYVVPINRTVSVALNVCRNLIFSESNLECGSDSAICLIDQSRYLQFRYVNLGNIYSNGSISFSEDRAIKITYENGEVCATNKTKRFRSTIKFFCDLSAMEGSPRYAGGMESCDLLFVWNTAAACSEETLIRQSVYSQQTCSIVDPVNFYRYDFSDISEKNINVSDTKGDNYQFSVCREINNVHCTEGSGMCKTLRGTNSTESGGTANSQVLWSPNEGLYLNYSHGDKCASGQYRHTIIRLVCDRANFFDITEDDCKTSITFPTRMACQYVCSSYRTGFERMMESTFSLEIKHLDVVFHLTTCSTIYPPKSHVYCTDGGSGICLVTDRVNQGHVETSLGYPANAAMAVGEGLTVLSYRDGSSCADYPAVPVSSQLLLKCDINVTKSLPDFVNYDRCIYYFEWQSRQSCGIVDCKMNPDCTIENDLGHFWNLAKLPITLIYSERTRKKSTAYKIDICGSTYAEHKKSVASTENNFGVFTNATVNYGENMTLSLYYGRGKPCANGTSLSRSVVYLVCDETKKLREPLLLWEEECSIGFEWKTSLVCSPELSKSREFWTAAVIINVLISTFVMMSAGLASWLVYAYCLFKKANAVDPKKERIAQYVRLSNSAERLLLLRRPAPQQL